MRIVIATPILYDSKSPFNHLFKDIIGGFVENGNQVIRLVAVRDENEIAFKYGYTDNVEYRLYKRKKSDHANIICRYIRDSITNIRQAIGILGMKEQDVLFEDVSYSSFWPVLASKIKKMKVVAMLQDVWPDNAVQSRLLKYNSLLYRYFEFWQRYVYRKADRLVCISDDMKAFLIQKGVDSNKIEVIYNWGYSDSIVDIPWEQNKFVQKFSLEKGISYIIYAGNIGKMQNVEIVAEAAGKLKDDKSIRFLIIGDGVNKEKIAEMVQREELTNITMLPMQPSELAEHIYSAASVNVIPLVPGGTKTAMPSKTGIVLSCGKPVIFCFDCDSAFREYVDRFKAGYVVSSNSGVELAERIKQILIQRDELRYDLFLHCFQRSKNVIKYNEQIMKC